MKKSLLIILSFLCTLGLFSCKKTETAVTPEELCFDIQRIQADMAFSSLKELYNPEPFEELKADVMAGKADRLESIFRIQKILKGYKCAHLRLEANDRAALFAKRVPFHFYCFGNDNYIYFAVQKYKKYLGWKLIKIGDLSVEDARDRIENFSIAPFETVTGEKYEFEYTLNFICLKEAGLVQKNGKARLTLESPDGEIKTISCKPITPSKFLKWEKISPEKENTLIYHYDVSKKYIVTPSEEKRTIYVQYNSCLEDPAYTIQNWFSDIASELKTGRYNTVVFDLRYNQGGQMSTQIAIDNELWKYKSEFDKCNLAIVTTGRTYSCACKFLNDFITLYPQVVLFGEETGQAVYNYTGYHVGNNLKKLNCIFVFPQQLDDEPELFKRAREVTHSDVHCGTLPDVEVSERFEDFMKGQDTIYNAIYDYFN